MTFQSFMHASPSLRQICQDYTFGTPHSPCYMFVCQNRTFGPAKGLACEEGVAWSNPIQPCAAVNSALSCLPPPPPPLAPACPCEIKSACQPLGVRFWKKADMKPFGRASCVTQRPLSSVTCYQHGSGSLKMQINKPSFRTLLLRKGCGKWNPRICDITKRASRHFPPEKAEIPSCITEVVGETPSDQPQPSDPERHGLAILFGCPSRLSPLSSTPRMLLQKNRKHPAKMNGVKSPKLPRLNNRGTNL